MTKPKILILDIETKPAIAYVWQMFKTNISPNQIIESGGILSFAAKWYGEKTTYFAAEWHDGGRKRMLRRLHLLLSEADAVVGYNSDKFDLAKINGEFLVEGFPPPPPPTSIDLIKTVRKMGFVMNRLAFVGPHLQLGDKLKHEGFELWSKVLDGNVKAQRKMEKYNIQDVALTEKLYDRIKPFIRNHPHLGTESRQCGSCGGNHLHSRGYRRTKYFKIQRLQCVTCGSWQDGARTKIG